MSETETIATLAPSTDRQAFTVQEFLYRNNLAKDAWFKLRKAGITPREMMINGRTLISIEAERDWRAARENPTGAEALGQALRRKERLERARAAAKRSVESPNHPRAASIQRNKQSTP
jgi:hypothetical protein